MRTPPPDNQDRGWLRMRDTTPILIIWYLYFLYIRQQKQAPQVYQAEISKDDLHTSVVKHLFFIYDLQQA